MCIRDRDIFHGNGSKEHQFLAAVNVEDVLLDVYPNILDNPKVTAKRGAIWPLFEKVGGVVKFEGDGMAITADRGTYKGVQLTRCLLYTSRCV